MIKRTLQARVREAAKHFPVLTITGPRQSGKTTLCRMTFPSKSYVSLEAPDVREFATQDPRGFLAEHRSGCILDEVQRAPSLLSYLQELVDSDPRPGRFVLTGSANFALLESVYQSLAGRTAVLQLLPLDREETHRFPRFPKDLFTTLWTGGYPAVFDRSVPVRDWYSSYVATYLERDVRQLVNVSDLLTFQTFLRICAGRSGQLLNLSGLGADCGITHNTARAWFSVLETSYLVFRLPPYHANVTSRAVKRPKMHFADTGLLCYLLGIETPDQIRRHPLRGAIFESWVCSEVLKARLHRGLPSNLFFYRDRKGLEVDLLLRKGDRIIAVEAKSGETIAPDFTANLDRLARQMSDSTEALNKVVVYGGLQGQRRSGVTVLGWEQAGGSRWI